MNPLRRGAGVGTAIALAACLTLPAQAQPVKPAAQNDAAFHRMEIWNGPVRTIHSFSHGFSPGEEAALRDLERAESGLAIADEVQGLHRLYLRNERVFEQRRGQVNPLLYGYSSESAGGGFDPASYAGLGRYPYAYLYGYPYGVGGIASSGTFGRGYATYTLASGVGNEGVMKNELARTLTDASASDAYARAARAYDVAVARVAESDRLRTALGWRKGEGSPVKEERWVGGQVSVTTKDGKTLDGKLVREEPEWVTVETATEEISLRKSEVTRIARPKKEAKPESP
jgi:hypothetical protein